jgi:hypothetical protein
MACGHENRWQMQTQNNEPNEPMPIHHKITAIHHFIRQNTRHIKHLMVDGSKSWLGASKIVTMLSQFPLDSIAFLQILICISSLPSMQAFLTRPPSTHHHIRTLAQNNEVFNYEDCYDLCDTWTDVGINNTPKEQKVNTNYKSSGRLRPPPWSDPKPTVCDTCSGNGDLICRFCEETGYLLSIGSRIQDCPVCKDGMESCHDCSGTGYVFSWNAKKNV